MWGCSLTCGFGGNCPGEGAALLPGFALGMSPALVQPAARGLEGSLCEQGKNSCMLLKGGHWVSCKMWALKSFFGVWKLLCIWEVQGAKHLCVSSKYFARDHAKFSFCLPWNIFLARKYCKCYHPRK